ncbi:RDD family protein [Flavobacterium sp. MAH-1]|uniref:RDD family protein n=1 Tax=Flavobacterium agri TaxID=2743471 RepID=A0A7Y8Y3B0_9FLAO|nr:RDD family protein [Flavobacterium agri]NUY81551.1 RDD family protein [Flavobacterium agri]NYA71575.1 RDD family protein [Flavobacterium agri]
MEYALRELEIPDHLLASSGQRFANYIVDYIAENAMNFGIIIILGYFMDTISASSDGFFFWRSTSLLQVFIGLFWSLTYYTMFELLTGRTLGKFVTGTIVVSKTAQKPTALQILGRSLSRLIPLDAFSFLFMSAGWHDRIPKTRVVRKSDYEQYIRQVDELDEIGKNQESL